MRKYIQNIQNFKSYIMFESADKDFQKNLDAINKMISDAIKNKDSKKLDDITKQLNNILKSQK